MSEWDELTPQQQEAFKRRLESYTVETCGPAGHPIGCVKGGVCGWCEQVSDILKMDDAREHGLAQQINDQVIELTELEKKLEQAQADAERRCCIPYCSGNGTYCQACVSTLEQKAEERGKAEGVEKEREALTRSDRLCNFCKNEIRARNKDET